MNEKKLNILTPIPFWHPGTQEFIDGLKQNGFTIVALDIWSFNYYDENQEIKNLVPKLFRGKGERVYKRLFRSYIIKKYIKKDQIVDIQWCGHYYSKYIKQIKKNSGKLFATLFGSDIYRSSTEEHKIQRKIFLEADKIVMGVNMAEDFSKLFPGLESKYLFAQYGSKRLDLIDEFAMHVDVSSLKQKYKIPKGKIAITVGYNSKPEQQHLKLIEIINSYDVSLKEKLFLIFPLTYGVSKEDNYYKKLISAIEGINVDHIIFENRLSDLELIETKFISDITINLQTTDALSSSIKEAFSSDNIVVVGDWLPYDVYEELGVFFMRRSLDQLSETLIQTISNIDSLKENCRSNREIIISFASWKHLIKQFILNYER